MDVGLFGPESVSWRINRERVLLVFGPRALLMQLAHPRVARGVEEHSDFRERPLRRLARTMTLSLNLVFGDTPTALRTVGLINRTHEGVRGDGYSAFDADLLTWVMATLVDSGVLAYETFVERLPASAKDRFYDEARGTARLLGAPESAMPPDFAALRRYVHDAIASGEVRVSAAACAAAHDTLYPPRLAYVPRLALDAVALVTAGSLPVALREQYALPWSRRHRAAFDLFVRAVRSLVPHLPPALRYVPQALAASRRARRDPQA